MDQLLGWDRKLFSEINSGFPTDHLDSFASFLSSNTTWWIAAFIALVLSWILKKPNLRKALVVGVLGLGLNDAFCSYVLKPTFKRERPCYQMQVKLRKPSCGSRNGMPSNHAANGAVVLSVSRFFLSGISSAIIAGVVILVGWSRIYLGVHFPLDIMVGYLVGSLMGLSFTIIAVKTSAYFKKQSKNAVTH